MRARQLYSLALVVVSLAFAACDAHEPRVYPALNVSGRWDGAGSYRNDGAYDAHLVFRQDPEYVYVDGTVDFTDAFGATSRTTYDLRATQTGRTVTFPAGFGEATLSEDGRTLRWNFGDGGGAFDLVRR